MKLTVLGRELDIAPVLAERIAIHEGRMILIRDLITEDGLIQCQAATYHDGDARQGKGTITWHDVPEGELYSRLPTFMKVASIDG